MCGYNLFLEGLSHCLFCLCIVFYAVSIETSFPLPSMLYSNLQQEIDRIVYTSCNFAECLFDTRRDIIITYDSVLKRKPMKLWKQFQRRRRIQCRASSKDILHELNVVYVVCLAEDGNMYVPMRLKTNPFQYYGPFLDNTIIGWCDYRLSFRRRSVAVTKATKTRSKLRPRQMGGQR